ncbi:hypothetical protein WISP_103717 [Willisornis vidua]|uniref:Uncharacterized protein n=1 Tax=Willisornis vidua TaxID=1566151 RepID=A0ABQ9CXL6_9PASS|nr:hypothetical protein WISP_103717 [Willisornis vidua]
MENGETSPEEKDLGMLVDEKLNRIWQCALTAQKGNSILGYIKRSMTSRLREMILSLYFILMTPQMEYCVQLWGPQHKKYQKNRLAREVVEFSSLEIFRNCLDAILCNVL